MTLPNIITVLRILLLPFLIYYLMLGDYLASLLIFALAGISDFLDGFIARRFSMTSKLGAILDPIADKLLVVVTITYFVMQELIPLWFLLIIIYRDACQFFGVVILKWKKVDYMPKSQVSGKFSTAANLIVVFMVILSHVYGGLVPYHDYVFYSATFFTLISIVHYSMLWVKLYSYVKE